MQDPRALTNKQTWILSLLALAAILAGFVGQVSLGFDIPIVGLRAAGELDATVVVGLMAVAAWAGLSALLRQLLVPSGFHAPLPRTSAAKPDNFTDTVAAESPPAVSTVEGVAFEAFGKDGEYSRPNGPAHEFYLVASTYADENGISFKKAIRWWGKTRPDRVPTRGRPNHYFAFDTGDDQSYLVYEVSHNGRAGSGASYSLPNTLRIQRSMFSSDSATSG